MAKKQKAVKADLPKKNNPVCADTVNAPTIRMAAVPLKSCAANIDVTFEMGLGHLSAKLFRNQAVIANGSIRRSGRITFNDVEVGDSIAIDGLGTGSTHLAMDVNSNPQTPRNYPEGDIFDELDIV